MGRVAVGEAELDGLGPLLPALQRSSPPCRAAGRAEIWLNPAIVCEVKFLASSQLGLRHPVFIRFGRPGLLAEVGVGSGFRAMRGIENDCRFLVMVTPLAWDRRQGILRVRSEIFGHATPARRRLQPPAR